MSGDTEASPTDRIVGETVRTTLADQLPSGGRIALLGDDRATADWLAERGHEVVRVISQREVDADEPVDSIGREAAAVQDDTGANASAGESDTGGVSVIVAEPMDLPFADDAFDAACWLGEGASAYTDGTRRTDAITEVARIVPADGPVVIAGLGRLAAVRLALAHSPEAVTDDLLRLVERGEFTAETLGDPLDSEASDAPEANPLVQRVPFYGYRLDAFEAELVNGDLVVDRVLGLDGAVLGADLAGVSDAAAHTVTEAVSRIHDERAVADGSFRLLAVCRPVAETTLDTEPTLVS